MTEPLTDEDLDAIEARLAGVAPGLWQSDPLTGTMVLDGLGREIVSSLAYPTDAIATTEFIAHCRADVPRLLAEVHRLRALLAARADGR
jgi:hypothetical protein